MDKTIINHPPAIAIFMWYKPFPVMGGKNGIVLPPLTIESSKKSNKSKPMTDPNGAAIYGAPTIPSMSAP